MNLTPLNALLEEIPAKHLGDVLDVVLVDYAIASVNDMQTQPAEEAVNNIRNLKRLRDAFYQMPEEKNISPA